jgi:hypothetical protein
MLFHLGIVLLLALICILFGLLRADLKDDNDEESCGNCQDQDSCEHFAFVGTVSRRETCPATKSNPKPADLCGPKLDC